MQAALSEAGILYASAPVHEGWQQVGRDGIVPYSKTLIGGHAFDIVGFDDRGFWVQNSWGPKWGAKGFCHIGYDDLLQNAFDCARKSTRMNFSTLCAYRLPSFSL